MKSLFETDAYQEIRQRLELLSPDDPPLWGRMSAGQMVWHCQFPLKLGIKNKANGVKAVSMLAWFFKKSLYNDRPWRKGLPTVRQAKAVEPKDFSEEYPKLLELVDAFHELKTREKWNPHPMFGQLTREQWGKSQYKHLDHHLRQFGK